MNILLTEHELGFLMSALRAQLGLTRGLDPLEMSAAQLDDLNTCQTIGTKAVDFNNPQEMIGDELVFNVPLTEEEATYLVVLFMGMLGCSAYDAKHGEHRLNLERSNDPPIDALLNDDFCHQLASKLGHPI
jgi:hypothetical protein